MYERIEQDGTIDDGYSASWRWISLQNKIHWQRRVTEAFRMRVCVCVWLSMSLCICFSFCDLTVCVCLFLGVCVVVRKDEWGSHLHMRCRVVVTKAISWFRFKQVTRLQLFFFLSNDTLSVLRGESRTLMETHNLVPLWNPEPCRSENLNKRFVCVSKGWILFVLSVLHDEM